MIAMLVSCFFGGALAIDARAAVQGAPASGASAFETSHVPRGPALDFSLNPRQMEGIYQTATAGLDATLAGIAAVPPGEARFANTAQAHESAVALWKQEINPLIFQSLVSPDPVVRQVAAALHGQAADHQIKRTLESGLLPQFQHAAAKNERLDSVDARLLERTILDFSENGAEPTPAQREKINVIHRDLLGLEMDLLRGANDGRQQEILQETFDTRRELARVLGYSSYPELAMRGRIVENPWEMRKFLHRMKNDAMEGLRAAPARSVFDQEEISVYFPLERVVEGAASVFQSLFGVSIQEIPHGPKWAEDVRLFAMTDSETGAPLGHFYLDLLRRQGKMDGWATIPIVAGRATEGTYENPVAAVLAPLRKDYPGYPVVLTHGEVASFFHEMGHAVHFMLSRARYARFCAFDGALDFVEVVSQWAENLVWERWVLDRISGHWGSGQKLPRSLYRRMAAERSGRESAVYVERVIVALVDLGLHEKAFDDILAAVDFLFQDLIGAAPGRGEEYVRSFGNNLIGLYGAGLYVYPFAKAFAEDLYTKFKPKGTQPPSPEIGARFRREILEQAGISRSEMESMRVFLGRETNERALRRRLQGRNAR